MITSVNTLNEILDQLAGKKYPIFLGNYYLRLWGETLILIYLFIKLWSRSLKANANQLDCLEIGVKSPNGRQVYHVSSWTDSRHHSSWDEIVPSQYIFNTLALVIKYIFISICILFCILYGHFYRKNFVRDKTIIYHYI